MHLCLIASVAPLVTANQCLVLGQHSGFRLQRLYDSNYPLYKRIPLFQKVPQIHEQTHGEQRTEACSPQKGLYFHTDHR